MYWLAQTYRRRIQTKLADYNEKQKQKSMVVPVERNPQDITQGKAKAKK